MPTNPDHAFTKSDKFERLYRREIAKYLNLGCEKSEVVDTNDVEHFADDDDRLTDEVCYSFVEWCSNCGDAVEATLEVLDEFPQIRTHAAFASE